MAKLWEKLKTIKNLDLIICIVAVVLIIAILFFDGWTFQSEDTFSTYIANLETKVEKALPFQGNLIRQENSRGSFASSREPYL